MPANRSLPPLWLIWLAVSALWVTGVFYWESLDGLLTEEFVETFAEALAPPIVPVVLLALSVRFFANLPRP